MASSRSGPQTGGLNAYLDDIIGDLKAQRGKLPDSEKQRGQELLSLAQKLQRLVRGDIDKPQPAPKKRREAAKRREADSSPTASYGTAQASAETLPVEGLITLIERAGWAMSEECIRLVDVIDQSLGDVLISGSSTHRALLADIEARLSAELSQ